MKRQEARSGWLLRGCVWGLVVALHMAGLALMVVMPMRSARSPASSDALQVRFIKMKSTPTPPQPAPAKVVNATQRSVAKRRLATTPAPVNTPLREEYSPAAPKEALNAPTQITWTPRPAGTSYVPGGQLLQGNMSMGPPKIKVPFGEHIKGAPNFHMVDPRSQGLAGVVRFIGGLTGAVDKHCLDLAAWQGMTPDERVKNHVDDSAMEQIEENYSCSTPQRRSVGG